MIASLTQGYAATAFTDRALLASVVLWFLYCFWVIYSPR